MSYADAIKKRLQEKETETQRITVDKSRSLFVNRTASTSGEPDGNLDKAHKQTEIPNKKKYQKSQYMKRNKQEIERETNTAPDAHSKDEYNESEADMQISASNESSEGLQTDNPKNRGYNIRSNNSSKPSGELSIEQRQTHKEFIYDFVHTISALLKSRKSKEELIQNLEAFLEKIIMIVSEEKN